MENLTPLQETDYNNAWTLALAANDAFDERQAAATGLAENGDLSEETAFDNANKAFHLYDSAAEALMPPRLAFETAEPAEPFASETVWSAMSHEQKTKANEVRSAMAEQLKDYGVTADNLRVVMSETQEGDKVFTLAHTGNGVDIGDHAKAYDEARSYNSVMAKKNDGLFTVQVDGQSYDARTGMTDSAYDALIADAKENGITLPDSEKAAKEADDVWTWTMLTGEELTARGNVQVRYVAGGKVRGRVYLPDRGYRDLRVRPAVVIE
jgi:hypothetical protein